jgi:catechol 2,3-dioxygenase-like lactoylglutathione lyase family enzyme
MVGSNNIERSKRFYDAVLATLGVGEPLRNKAASGHTRLFYRHDGGTIGAMHLAYVRDPDGNKLCAIHRVR